LSNLELLLMAVSIWWSYYTYSFQGACHSIDVCLVPSEVYLLQVVVL